MSPSNKKLLKRERELSLRRNKNLTKIVFKLSGARRTALRISSARRRAKAMYARKQVAKILTRKEDVYGLSNH